MNRAKKFGGLYTCSPITHAWGREGVKLRRRDRYRYSREGYCNDVYRYRYNDLTPERHSTNSVYRYRYEGYDGPMPAL